MHHDDLVRQSQADRVFLDRLSRSPFTGQAAEPAQRLATTVQAYLGMLDRAAAQPGYFTTYQDSFAQLDERRAEASSDLRQALQLPQSGCEVSRPCPGRQSTGLAMSPVRARRLPWRESITRRRRRCG